MPPKKARHRHSATQLASLNALYEQTEHPTLSQRIALAESVGLETKSVNSYFQNKRASTKKRPRGVPYMSPSSARPSPHPDIDQDEAFSLSQSATLPPLHSDVPMPSESLESIPHGSRSLRSSDQMDDLEQNYTPDPHPTVEDLSAGMRYQNGTNRSHTELALANNSQNDGGDYADTAPDSSHPFPPALDQPSLTERGRLSPSSSAVDALVSRSRRTSSRRSATPYSTSAATSVPARQASRRLMTPRMRPSNFQLEALKHLNSRTSTPSIEERSALALEIGMEVGKVTNWFRNLRQSARKREKKVGRRHGGGSEDDLDYTDSYFYSPSASASASRAGTPSLEGEDVRQRHPRRALNSHSSDDDEDEDEEYPQEAVTPSPSQSPSPTSSPSLARVLDFSVAAALQDAMAQMAKVDKFKDLAEDALLLLEFQATCQ
ncbi:homeobox-domain-containing protein [Mycena vitilis]|nr:homeobox-domain-containing protein [Mycena vitilis]